MPKIDRIVFTGDVFRTYAGERSQIENVRWLVRHFSPMLSSLTRLPTEIRLAGTEPFDDNDLLASWYGLLGSAPSMDSWARHFDDVPSRAVIEAVASDYLDALVISIEMSPILQRILDASAIPWIDIGVSPLRFLEDYAISFRLSHHFDGKFPVEMTLRKDEIERSVQQVRRTYHEQPTTGLNGAIVFFAQTSQDRTLIKNGRFVGAKEAVEGLRQVRSDRQILIKPHPLEAGNPVVKAVISEFDAEIIDSNTYAILASAADVSVATLSSSVGRESKVFGKETHIFHPEVQSATLSGPTALKYALSSSLWRSLLSPLLDVYDIKTLPWQPNMLRKEIGYYGLDPAVWEVERKVAFYDLDEAKRIRLTEKAIAEQRTLHERWVNLATPEAEPWNERAAVAASYLTGEQTVADFGCGTMSLKRYLGSDVSYVPIDVSSRGPDTIVCDFNVDPPPQTEASAAAILGVLEYLFDPTKFMVDLSKNYSTAVVSYCIIDAVETAPNRRAHAWVNDLSKSEVEAIFLSSGWAIEKTEPVGTFQQIWKLKRQDPKRTSGEGWLRSIFSRS